MSTFLKYKSLGVTFFFYFGATLSREVCFCFIIAFFTVVKIIISLTLSIWLYTYSIFPWNLNKFKLFHGINSADVYLYPYSLRKLVNAISLRFAQTDSIKRLNFVQLPKIIFAKRLVIDWINRVLRRNGNISAIWRQKKLVDSNLKTINAILIINLNSWNLL